VWGGWWEADLASVMQAGRSKSNRMPMRYGEHAARGGMGRAEGGAGYEAMIISGRWSSHFFHI
jgi:hypothetical protein